MLSPVRLQVNQQLFALNIQIALKQDDRGKVTSYIEQILSFKEYVSANICKIGLQEITKQTSCTTTIYQQMARLVATSIMHPESSAIDSLQLAAQYCRLDSDIERVYQILQAYCKKVNGDTAHHGSSLPSAKGLETYSSLLEFGSSWIYSTVKKLRVALGKKQHGKGQKLERVGLHLQEYVRCPLWREEELAHGSMLFLDWKDSQVSDINDDKSIGPPFELACIRPTQYTHFIDVNSAAENDAMKAVQHTPINTPIKTCSLAHGQQAHVHGLQSLNPASIQMRNFASRLDTEAKIESLAVSDECDKEYSHQHGRHTAYKTDGSMPNAAPSTFNSHPQSVTNAPSITDTCSIVSKSNRISSPFQHDPPTESVILQNHGENSSTLYQGRRATEVQGYDADQYQPHPVTDTRSQHESQQWGPRKNKPKINISINSIFQCSPGNSWLHAILHAEERCYNMLGKTLQNQVLSPSDPQVKTRGSTRKGHGNAQQADVSDYGTHNSREPSGTVTTEEYRAQRNLSCDSQPGRNTCSFVMRSSEHCSRSLEGASSLSFPSPGATRRNFATVHIRDTRTSQLHIQPSFKRFITSGSLIQNAHQIYEQPCKRIKTGGNNTDCIDEGPATMLTQPDGIDELDVI